MAQFRRVAVALPARDEVASLPACLAALDAAAAVHGGPVAILVFANQCSDGTVDLLRRTRLAHAELHWRAASLLPGAAKAAYVFVVDAHGDIVAHTFAPEVPAELRNLVDGQHDTVYRRVRVAGQVEAGWRSLASCKSGQQDEISVPNSNDSSRLKQIN